MKPVLIDDGYTTLRLSGGATDSLSSSLPSWFGLFFAYSRNRIVLTASHNRDTFPVHTCILLMNQGIIASGFSSVLSFGFASLNLFYRA